MSAKKLRMLFLVTIFLATNLFNVVIKFILSVIFNRILLNI
jgi:hypothetical protein